MPEPRYDDNPNWEYAFPVPAVNLAVTESAVVPPYLVKCVGVDGRRKGSLRRFPGFKLIRDLTSDISGLANIERFWYVSIQKGATPYVLRGFVVLADSLTDSTFKALFLVAFDTQDQVWRNYTLEDFAADDRITGVRVVNTWMSDAMSDDYTFPLEIHAAYVSDRQAVYIWPEDNTKRVALLDITSGRLIRLLPSTLGGSDQVRGGAYHRLDKKLYTTRAPAGLPQLSEINLDTGAVTGVVSFSPAEDLRDLAYDPSAKVLWGVTITSEPNRLFQINEVSGALTGEVILPAGVSFGSIAWSNDDNKLYGITARKLQTGADQDVRLYEINTTTGAITEKFNFETNGFGQDGREPIGDLGDITTDAGALIIPDGTGTQYVLAAQTQLYLEVDSSVGPRTYDSVDVSSTWRYIYATFEAQDIRRGLNRAYFWNPDTSTVEGRFSGFLNSAALEDSRVTAQTTDGVIDIEKRVSAAYRLASRRHAIFSPLSKVFQVTTEDTGSPNDNHIRLEINQFNLPTDLSIDDLDIEVFRTIGVDGNLSVDDIPLLGNLYPDNLSALLDRETADTAFVHAGRSELRFDNAKSDRELSARIPFDFRLQHVGLVPRAALLLATEDQIFIVAKPFLGDDPSTRFVEFSEKASWRVMWSPPEKYELENFRGAVTGEQYRFPDARATIFSLEKVGDFIFACTDLGVIRFHKSGSYVAVNPLAFKWGVAGRDASTSMGNRLVVATTVGLMGVDGPSMQEEGFGVVQRLLASTEFWRADIASINLAYDAQLGALILFNPVRDEMFLLWPDTGAVTSLEDCPWIQGAEGVDPVNGGSPRSFWITADGRVHAPDAAETADKKTMYGASSTDTVNGSATGGSTTTLIDTSAAFGSGAKDFQVHFLSGSNQGESRQISVVTGTQLTWTPALNTAIVAGDRYAVAPIPFRARGHQVPGTGALTLFKRKITVSMAANIDLLGGEDTDANPNLKMSYKMYRHLGDTAPQEAVVNMVEDAGQMWNFVPAQDTILFPEWVCLASNLDFQLLGGRVSGKISTSGSISSPQSVT